MILPFLQYFDKKKQKPTHFMEKIYRAFLWNDEEIKAFANEIKSEISKNTFFDMEFSFNSPPKIHTIITDAKNRWQAGCKIHAVYNYRSKNQFQFAPTFECKSVQMIHIYSCHTAYNEYNRRVIIDGKILSIKEIEILAKNDGFDSVDDFLNSFDSDFIGRIIHFTDFRY